VPLNDYFYSCLRIPFKNSVTIQKEKDLWGDPSDMGIRL